MRSKCGSRAGASPFVTFVAVPVVKSKYRTCSEGAYRVYARREPSADHDGPVFVDKLSSRTWGRQAAPGTQVATSYTRSWYREDVSATTTASRFPTGDQLAQIIGRVLVVRLRGLMGSVVWIPRARS